MLEAGVSACTDITGFGFLGHACEMVRVGGIGMKIRATAVPILPGVVEFARMGLIPGGTYRNKDFRAAMVDFSDRLPEYMPDILFDPQTSGGLLMAVNASRADALLARLHEAGMLEAALVGEVVASPAGRITVE